MKMLSRFIKNFNEKGEVYLRIKANPSAGKTEIKEILDDETIKINISAPAKKGEANQELIKFLAKNFCVKKGNVKIISGAGNKIKLIKIKI